MGSFKAFRSRAKINCTPKTWRLADYAQKYATQGKRDYQELLEFHEEHKIPIGTAAALLAGTTSYTNISNVYVSGLFKVKDREWAGRVASLYAAIIVVSAMKHNTRLMDACMSCCRVDGLDLNRMSKNAVMCREKLVSYSTRDAYLVMLEEVYNFKRMKKLPLKFLAQQAMEQRNAAKRAKSNGSADKSR